MNFSLTYCYRKFKYNMRVNAAWILIFKNTLNWYCSKKEMDYKAFLNHIPDQLLSIIRHIDPII